MLISPMRGPPSAPRHVRASEDDRVSAPPGTSGGRLHRGPADARRGPVRRDQGRAHRTTIATTGECRRADLLDRDFTAAAPNRKWVTDFTTPAPGWVRLCGVRHQLLLHGRSWPPPPLRNRDGDDGPLNTLGDVELITADYVSCLDMQVILSVCWALRESARMLWAWRLFTPCLVRPADGGGVPRLGHRLLDEYLEMVAARARPNTVLATAFDLKVFFAVVGRDPVEVSEADAGVHPVPAAAAPRCVGGAYRGR